MLGTGPTRRGRSGDLRRTALARASHGASCAEGCAGPGLGIPPTERSHTDSQRALRCGCPGTALRPPVARPTLGTDPI
eukprot:8903974-Alexandrium_andersonii.AAC.1